MNTIVATPAPLTRDDIARIRVGATVSMTFETAHGVPLAGARWSPPRRVTRVFARQDDLRGRAFVCFYTEYGERAEISASAKEGDVHVRVVADAI